MAIFILLTIIPIVLKIIDYVLIVTDNTAEDYEAFWNEINEKLATIKANKEALYKEYEHYKNYAFSSKEAEIRLISLHNEYAEICKKEVQLEHDIQVFGSNRFNSKHLKDEIEQNIASCNQRYRMAKLDVKFLEKQVGK